MNITTVAKNLRAMIAGKEKYLSDLKTTEVVETADRIYRATTVGMLDANIAELKLILADVESCCEQTTR